jgi:hypothetical protein
MPAQPSGDSQGQIAAHADDRVVVRSVLGTALAELSSRLDRAPELDERSLADALSSTLADVTWPTPGYRVRRDRGRDRTAARGAWRFDLVVERPDRVTAVVDIYAGPIDLEGKVIALSRLSLARGRGVAETAYLLVAEPVEHQPGPGLSAAASPRIPGASSASPITTVVFAPRGGAPWRLSLFEAAEAPLG